MLQGSIISLRCCLRNPGLFRGAVFEAPLIRVAEEHDTLIKYVLAKIFSWLYPELKVEKIDAQDVSSGIRQTRVGIAISSI